MERWEIVDTAAPDVARAELRICCGASRWIERMMARRPFGSRDAARRAARQDWFALGPDDWREAFTHHPSIGARVQAGTLSAREQSGVSGSSDAVRAALLEKNREYEARFGYIFIVCASGKSAEEMLAILEARLHNDPETEIRIAAEEHAKICDLRLAASAA